MLKVTNNKFSHLRSRNEAFHKPRVPTGFVKMGHLSSFFFIHSQISHN